MSSLTPHDGQTPPRGPRAALARVLDVAFVIALVAMLAVGAVLVLLQLGGLLARSPQFVIDTEAVLGPPTYAIAASLGVLTLLVSLAHGWRPSE